MSAQHTISKRSHYGAAIKVRYLLIIIGITLVLLMGLKAWQVYTAAQALRDDLRALEDVAAHPSRDQIVALGPLLARAHADAVALRLTSAPLLPIARHLSWLPGYGADFAAAPDLLDLAVGLTDGAESSYIGVMPALRPLANGEVAGTTLMQRLENAQPDLLRAQQSLAQAAEAWARVPQAQLSPELRAPLARVDELLPAARDGVAIALALPDLLGAHGRHDYLVVAQNPDELRPTGGLMTAAGVLGVEQGRVVEFSLADSGTITNLAANGPYPDAPAPLQRYMGIDLWTFPDANWSPDLPTAAATISDLYGRGQNRSVRDVIAIDPAGLQLLIGALGPLEVEGSNAPITAANVQAYLRNAVFFGVQQTGNAAADAPWWVQRKQFLAPLGRALLARAEQGGAQIDWLLVFGALRQAFDERHLQVVVQEPAVADAMYNRGWDGAVRAVDGDFLLLNAANMGYNKVSLLVQQSISYTADLSAPETPIGELTLRQRNTASGVPECDQRRGLNEIVSAKRYEDLMAGCAWIYQRALLPEGSELIAALGVPTPAAWLLSGQADNGAVTLEPGDARTSALATMLVIPPGEARRIFARYRLPAAVLTQDDQGWHYQLTLQKQAGTPPLPATVRVRMPKGAVLLSSSMPLARQEGQDLVFQLTLSTEQTLTVDFRPAAGQ